MDNVLFFPIWLISPHFETDLELIIAEIEAGNNVYFIKCNKDLNICDNKIKNISCIECKKISKRAINFINLKYRNKIKQIFLKKYIKLFMNINFPDNVNNVKKLHELKFETYDIGYAIASSLAEELDSSSFEDCREKVVNCFSEAINFYRYIKIIINDYKISKGYIFNARFCFSRAFFQAFLDKNITIYMHERGSNFNKYVIIKNKLVHDIDGYTERVNFFWNDEPDLFFKKNVADVFFKKKYLGEETSYISYTAQQNTLKIPDEIYNYKKIIVIYNSSDYEFDNIGKEYTYKYYLSQEDGINKIVESLKNEKDIGVFLREHPNQKNRYNAQRESIRRINADNFYLIPAESDISSYKLMFNADIVITFNSTMGIEASYWGIPSILCSNAIYEKINISYLPKSHEEVINLIKSDLKPIASDGVYKYGYYNSTFGNKFKYYKPINLFEGLFLDVNLHSEKYYFDLLYFIKEKIILKIKSKLIKGK